VARTLGRGGPSLLERELGWSRKTIRKAISELESGITCIDDYAARGRQRAEVNLPHLLDDIQAIAEQHSQTDPTFHSTRLYLRLSAASVREQLLTTYSYTDATLPSAEVIRQRLNALGYQLRAVKKVSP
jgi:biotin operon repressor